MSERRYTLTNVMRGVKKHKLADKLSDGCYKFLVELILEANELGFKNPIDLTLKQALAIGGGESRQTLSNRRKALKKIMLNGKHLVKVKIGNYGKNSLASYEIDYDLLCVYNNVWQGIDDVSSNEIDESLTQPLRPFDDPLDDPLHILRSDQKRREEKSSSSTTPNIVITEEQPDKPPKDDEDERFKWLLGLMQNAAPGWAPANDTQRQMVFELLEFTNGEIETVFHRAAQEGIRRNKLLGWVQRGLDNFDKFYSRAGIPIETKELTRAESIVEWLRYCAGYRNRQHEIYPTLEALAEETGRPLLELFSENEYLTLSLDYYKEIAEEHPE